MDVRANVCRWTFADLHVRVSLSSKARERNYYRSEHGKGEGDGKIGVDQAVLGCKITINLAKDVWDWEWCSTCQPG